MTGWEQNGSLQASASQRQVTERVVLAMSHTIIAQPLMTDGDEPGGWIYCYYFPYVRRAKQQTGSSIWPCKVGSTTKPDPRMRVAEQFEPTGVFEPPVIAFAARSADPDTLEKAIHDRLSHCNLKRTEGVGKEWFDTNPKRVRRAYRQVKWPDRWGYRMVKMITMEFRAWRLGV